ncbi:MAG: Gfo/Idh/MocA family oxidoreductase [Chloroflexota bacterium]|nr:MAG: oxidoreductase [Chloroflexota bacterium]
MKHRLAIIGTGRSVSNHLTAVRALADRVDLVAAVDVNTARLAAICEANGIPHQYGSATEMLKAERPELVVIVTPPATHKDLIIECMEAGAWVWCEKPLCGSLAELDELEEAERRTGRAVSTVFQWRFGSAGKHLKSLIAAGALGRPLIGICNTLWYRPQEYYADDWRGRWKTELGGPTMTLGVHLMDLLLWLMGDWREIRAMIDTIERDIEVEDMSMAMVRFENGAVGSIVNSVLSPRQESYLRLDFQKATVEVATLYRYSNQHWRFSQPPDVDDPAVSAHWNALKEDVTGGHEAQLREILDALERGERPPVSVDDSRRTLEFIASLYKSALTDRAVERGEITRDDPFYYAMNGSTEGLTAR